MPKFWKQNVVLINSILDEHLFTDDVLDDLWEMHNDNDLATADIVCLNVTYDFEEFVSAEPNETVKYPHLMCWLSKLFPGFGANHTEDPEIIVEVHWR